MVMYTYIKIYIITTLLFFIFSINYVVLRENDIFLFLGSYLDYEFNIFRLFLYYFISVPFLSYILYKSIINIYAMLLSNLIIIGTLPGIVVYALSSHDSVYVYIIFNVYMIFLLLLFERKKINILNRRKYYNNDYDLKLNLSFIKLVSYFGAIFYMYLFIKYFNILSFSKLDEIYLQRDLFATLIQKWEAYPLMISKTLSAFSFLVLALKEKKIYYLFPSMFIFLTDYLLAAHKSSLFMIIFIFFYYYVSNYVNIIKYYYYLITFGIFIFSVILNFYIYLFSDFSMIIVSIYDRMFFASVGLFSRIYDYTEEFDFFYGGIGLLGKFFSDGTQTLASTIIIGEYFFNVKNTQANVDFISDGYLEFGIIGSLLQILFLWLFFNRSDNQNFKNNFVLILPFVFVYSRIITATGLQIALLSSGMIFFIIYFKIAFKKIKPGGVKNENT